MSLTGSKGSSNVSVVFLGEFDLDLILVFFLMQLLEFVFLIAGVFSPAQVNEWSTWGKKELTDMWIQELAF